METFSDTGDLILVLNSSTRLLVSSAQLIIASSTFKTMLTGPFAEGQQRSTPKEIELPDDDPVSMRILMNILHHRNRFAPMRLDLPDLLKVAKLVDKYDCTESFKFASSIWLNEKATNTLTLDEHFTLIATAYLLEDHRAFRFHTRALILEHTLAVSELLDKVGGDALPEKSQLRVALVMEKQRINTLATLESEMEMVAKCSCSYASSCAASTTKSHIKRFLNETLNQQSFIGSTRVVLKGLFGQLRMYKGTDSSCMYRKFRTAMETEKALLAALDRTEKLANGICLICLRGGCDGVEACVDHLGNLED